MSSPREEEAGRTESRFLLFGPTGEGLFFFGRNGQRPSSVPADIDCALSNYPTTRMNKDRAANEFVMHLRRVEASGQKNMSSARQMHRQQRTVCLGYTAIVSPIAIIGRLFPCETVDSAFHD